MGYIAMCALSRAKNELAADDESSMVVMPMRRALGLMVFVLAVAGCAAQGPYRRGEQAIEQFVADPALCQELKAPSSLRIPDRKSTRLNSSHGYISYAVFCLKKKKKKTRQRLDKSMY